MQTRWESTKEALENIAIGYCLSVVGNFSYVFFFGPMHDFVSSLSVGVWMTAISFARQYVIRRKWNKKLQRKMPGV